jgi:phosphomannomutase
MALMISVSGIRGIFGTDLTPENLARFTAAYGSWLKGGKVVVGRDSRISGKVCEDIVVSTLKSVGCTVIRVGIVPTPTVAMGVLKHQADGGIIISASHNPGEWNALKLLNSKSEFLDAEQGKEVITLSETGDFSYVDAFHLGEEMEDYELLEHHIDAILELPYIDANLIAKQGYKVAVDAVNGAGSYSVPRLLERLGVEVAAIHCTPNGHFPHNPEPLPEHLGEICELVRKENAHLGVVTDPDADRLALVDDLGRLFGEEYTQATAFDFILSKNPGPSATNLSSSRICDVVAEQYGQVCHRSAVGEINVVKKMQEVGAVIGGEGNGGVILPELHYGRDALAGIALTLQLLAERGLSASEYRDQWPTFHMSKNKIQLTDLGASAPEVLSMVESHYSSLSPDTTDGVKVNFDEGWVHLRPSNTEPIVRIYAEGPSNDAANAFAKRIKDQIAAQFGVFLMLILWLLVPFFTPFTAQSQLQAQTTENVSTHSIESSSAEGSSDWVYTEQDVALFHEIMATYAPYKDEPMADLIPKIGRFFEGQPYVAFALETTDEEQLIINLRELDCTTYAEHLLALSRTLKSETQNFEAFAQNLEAIRYRDGQRGSYPSRLHYFSEWIYNNAQLGLVETPADQFGSPYPNELSFMSEHPSAYKHLAQNPSYVQQIQGLEAELSQNQYSFIPKSEYLRLESQLRSGDIVGFTTDIKGLDVSHVGIVVDIDGVFHLMHASQSNQKVEVSDEPLAYFLRPESKHTGIMIARPVNL